MFRKLGRAMAGHDLGHDFLLYKTPRPITRRALVISEKVFTRVVIQRCHAVWLHLRVRNSCTSLLRIVRRGRGGEVLEAQIIPEQIEHWIESEQRRCERQA